MGMKENGGPKGMKKKGSRAIGQKRFLVSTGSKLHPKMEIPAIVEVSTQNVDWRTSWRSSGTSTGKPAANNQLIVT